MTNDKMKGILGWVTTSNGVSHTQPQQQQYAPSGLPLIKIGATVRYKNVKNDAVGTVRPFPEGWAHTYEEVAVEWNFNKFRITVELYSNLEVVDE